MIEAENWKDIKGYEGLYQVSDLGRVRSLTRTVTDSWGRKRTWQGSIRKLVLDKYGYLIVNLTNKQKTQFLKVHRLVASAFIPNASDLPMVNHLDGNKENNQVSNLEWCDAKRSTTHAIKNGLRLSSVGSNNIQAKLNESDVLFIKYWLSKGYTLKQIANAFGVRPTSIGNIKTGYSWAHVA